MDLTQKRMFPDTPGKMYSEDTLYVEVEGMQECLDFCEELFGDICDVHINGSCEAIIAQPKNKACAMTMVNRVQLIDKSKDLPGLFNTDMFIKTLVRLAHTY